MSIGDTIKQTLELSSDPVAVYLRPAGAAPAPFPDGRWSTAEKHRYCQALMRARHGDFVLLGPEDVSCPAAAAAFGFKDLPEGLASGRGLVGFGIAQDEAVGRAMFDGMSRLSPESLTLLALCPLSQVPGSDGELSLPNPPPDVVVVEGPPEALMWLLLADLNVAGGERRIGNTAVLQATCVDSTIVPYLEGRLNFGFGCYGCREATDIGPEETVLGFPGDRLGPLAQQLERLEEKAIPKARAKATFERFRSE